MPTAPMAIHGVVRGGVVVPDTATGLPEGTRVTILVGEPTTGRELAEELAAWERASDEAWSMIDWGDGEIARDAG
jgi:hypothetical protein